LRDWVRKKGKGEIVTKKGGGYKINMSFQWQSMPPLSKRVVTNNLRRAYGAYQQRRILRRGGGVVRTIFSKGDTRAPSIGWELRCQVGLGERKGKRGEEKICGIHKEEKEKKVQKMSVCSTRVRIISRDHFRDYVKGGEDFGTGEGEEKRETKGVSWYHKRWRREIETGAKQTSS